MSKIKLTIQYFGTDFCGWQSQKNGTAVQNVVEKALGNYFGVPFVRIYAAGRTDVGVHARGQVAHFCTEKPTNLFKLCLGVNLHLPDSVAVVSAEEVTDEFDARFSAVSKDYCYRVYVSPTRNPLLDKTYLQVYKPLDAEKMRAAARLLVGTHDFAAFQKKGSNLKGTVRTINSFEIVETRNILSKNKITVGQCVAENICASDNAVETAEQTVCLAANGQSGQIFEFWVNGNAFLYNQVRNMCGLLLEIGRGNFQVDDVQKMLNGENLRFRTLPPRGLTLEKVYY